MKNIITILLVIMTGCGQEGMSQTSNISLLHIDSGMISSVNPGAYFLDQVHSYLKNHAMDTTEGNDNNALRRAYAFWEKRLPTIDSQANPFVLYAQTMNVAKSSKGCTITNLQSNQKSNWENIGPQMETQSQGFVEALWIHPSNDPHPQNVKTAQAAMRHTGQMQVDYRISSTNFDDKKAYYIIDERLCADQDRFIDGSTTGRVGSDGLQHSPYDSERAFVFPRDVEGAYMYLADNNLFRSEPQGYGKNNSEYWTQLTEHGGPWETSSISKLHERAYDIEISNTNPNVIYYVQKRYKEKIDSTDAIFMVREEDPLTGGKRWINKTNKICHIIASSDQRDLVDIVTDPSNGDRIWLCFEGLEKDADMPMSTKVLYSADRGNSFTDVSTGLPGVPITQLLYQEGSDEVLYAATDIGVFRWHKPSQCWTKFDQMKDGVSHMPKVLVSDMVIDYGRRKLVITTFGSGIWETDLYVND